MHQPSTLQLRRPPASEATHGRLDASTARRVAVVAALLLVATAMAFAFLLPEVAAHDHRDSLPWWSLALGFGLSELFMVHLPFRRKGHTFSMSELPLAAGLVLLASPVELVAAQLLGAGLVMAFWRRQAPVKVALNLTIFAFTTTVAWAVVHLGHGFVEAFTTADFALVLLAVVVAGLLQTLLVTVVLHVVGEEVGPGVARQAVAFSVLSATANGSLAVLGIHLASVASNGIAWLVVAPVALLVAAYRAGLHERERARGLAVQHGIARDLLATNDIDEVGRRLLPAVRAQLRSERVELLLWGDGGDRCLRSVGDASGVVTASELDAHRGQDLLRHKLDLLGPILQPKCSDGPLHGYAELRGFGDVVAVPLGRPGNSVGALVASDRHGQVDSFTDEDLSFLVDVAATTGVHVERLRLGGTVEELVAHRDLALTRDRVDDVTGLPRRRALEDATVDPAPRAVIALRIGGVEDVHDALGGDSARDLLASVARRLRRTVRRDDLLVLVEDATFAVLAPINEDVEVLDGLANMLRQIVLAPHKLEDREVVVSAHVGLSLDVEGRRAGNVLLAEALAAAREALSRPEEAYVTFHDELRDLAHRRTVLASDLNRAARSGDGIAAVYQPIVDVGTGAVVGIEALARWTHPDLGPVSPAEFLPIASRIGVMPELGRALLRRALDDSAAWSVDGALVGLTINLSAEQLRDPATTATLEQLLAEHHVDSHRLTIDLDASTITHGLDELRSPIERMSRLGVNIALDDFSVEADVASVLAQLPVDVIKIPGSLVGAGADRPIDGVLRALLDLGRDLGVGIVVEGLEEAEQLASLQQLGGNAMAQGYLVAPPLEADAVGTLLRALTSRNPADSATVIHLHEGNVG